MNLYEFVGNSSATDIDFLGHKIGTTTYKKRDKSWTETTVKFAYVDFDSEKCLCRYGMLSTKRYKEEFQNYYVHYTTDAAADALLDAIAAFDPTPFFDIIGAIMGSISNNSLPSGAEIYDISKSTLPGTITTSRVSGPTFIGFYDEGARSAAECPKIQDKVSSSDEKEY